MNARTKVLPRLTTHRKTAIWTLVLMLLALLAACSDDRPSPMEPAAASPAQLSEGGASGALLGGGDADGPKVWTDKDDYVPHEPVSIMGSGWEPDETVDLTLAEEPKIHPNRTFSVVADSLGTFAYEEFAPEDHHAGVTFLLTAVGRSSGYEAQWTFTDEIALGDFSTNFNGPGSSPTSSSQQNLVMSAPAVSAADVAAGALLVAQVAITDDVGSTVVCAQTGWELVRLTRDAQNKVASAIFRRVVTAAQGATSYTFSFRASCPSGTARNKGAVGGIIRYTGVDVNHLNGPIEVSDGTPGTNSTTSGTAPQVTTSGPDARVIRFFAMFKEATIGPSASPPRIYSRTSKEIKEVAAAAFDANQANAGPTGTFTGTFSTSGEWVAQTVALRAVPAGPTCTAPSVTTHPSNQSITYGDDAVFTAAGSGEPAPSVKWQVSTDAGSSWSDIPGETSTTLELTNPAVSQSGNRYRAVFSNECGGTQTATSNAATLTVNKADQAITFTSTAPSNAVPGDTYAPAATGGGSGNPVTFGASGACSHSGGTVTMTGAGECTVTADQAGNDNYYAAPQKTQVFTVGSAATSVGSITASASTYGGTTNLSATVSPSGVAGSVAFYVAGSASAAAGTVSYNASTGLATLNGYAHGLDASPTAYSVRAVFTSSNASYAGSEETNASALTVGKAAQAISWSDPADITYGTALGGTQLNATLTTGNGALTYDPPSGTVLSVGTHTLRVDAAETVTYAAAFKEVWITVNKATGTIDLSNLLQPYSGYVLSPTATTNPAGMNVNLVFTQDGYPATPKDVGVYHVRATIDDQNYEGATEAFFVIYDPSAGFITGGGWIASPANACRTSVCLDEYGESLGITGKANFGFNAKYKKGANKPDGQTQFQFQAGNLNFHSTSYDWLVVAGQDQAKFKGVGTINGQGQYGFMITGIDGSKAADGLDRFRIKIWDMNNGNAVVYDNQLGKSDDGYDATVLGGGSIRIHQEGGQGGGKK